MSKRAKFIALAKAGGKRKDFFNLAKEEGLLIQRAEAFGFRLCYGADELGWRCLCFELAK